MPVLPANVQEVCTRSGQPIVDCLGKLGWRRVHQGKVRDTYENDNFPDKYLVVATDRLSIFDFVLPTQVPRKGEVLTALTHFWLTQILSDFPNHLATSVIEDERIPRERCLLVNKLNIQPFELIFRHHIGGSVWKQYQEDGTAGGHHLPVGLTKWQRLESPIFTPSDKSDTGHDVNITYADYFSQMGESGRLCVDMLTSAYRRAYDYAKYRGVLILDTKFESNLLMIADEVLTPDSSRYTSVEDFEKSQAEGRDPIFYDKQFVREWGKGVDTPWCRGLDNKSLKPDNPEHLAFVHSLEVPGGIVTQTSQIYLQINEMITGDNLDEYQRIFMGVN